LRSWGSNETKTTKNKLPEAPTSTTWPAQESANFDTETLKVTDWVFKQMAQWDVKWAWMINKKKLAILKIITKNWKQ
jgi:hypothetical protein